MLMSRTSYSERPTGFGPVGNYLQQSILCFNPRSIRANALKQITVLGGWIVTNLQVTNLQAEGFMHCRVSPVLVTGGRLRM